MFFSFIFKVNGGKKASCPDLSIITERASIKFVKYLPAKVTSAFMINLTVGNPDFVAAAWVEYVKLRKKLPSFRLHTALYNNLFKSGNHAVVNRSKQMLMAIPANLWCFSDFHELVRVLKDLTEEGNIRMLQGRIAAMEYMVRIFEVSLMS